MKRIETLEALQAERRLTKQKIARLELQIEEDIEEIRNSLRPVKMAGQAVKDLLSSERSGVIAGSIDLAVDALVKKLLLRKSNWIIRLATSFFLKKYAKNMYSKNADNILQWVKDKMKKPDADSRVHYEVAMDDVNWDV